MSSVFMLLGGSSVFKEGISRGARLCSKEN